jgi:hypothetical protein
MNLLLWLLVLAGGAALGLGFANAGPGLLLSSLGGAALFPFAALLIRLVIWAFTSSSWR